jgi:hypothetical protein
MSNPLSMLLVVIVIFIISKFIDSIIIFRLFVRCERHITSNINNSIYFLQEFLINKEASDKLKEFLNQSEEKSFSKWYDKKYGEDLTH